MVSLVHGTRFVMRHLLAITRTVLLEDLLSSLPDDGNAGGTAEAVASFASKRYSVKSRAMSNWSLVSKRVRQTSRYPLRCSSPILLSCPYETVPSAH